MIFEEGMEEVAGVGRRALALIVDLALLCAPALALYPLTDLLFGPCRGWPGGMGCLVAYMLLAGGITAVLLLVQAALFVARGQTLGRRVLGIRVVRLDGRPAGAVRGLVLPLAPYACVGVMLAGAHDESMMGVVVLVVVIVDLIATVLPPGRALYDRMAGTVTVRAHPAQDAGGQAEDY